MNKNISIILLYLHLLLVLTEEGYVYFPNLLHLDICRHYGIKVEAECWYQHKPEQVMENEKATILWDSPVITDRHAPCNKADIVIQEKKSDRCQIIDIM